MVVCVCVSVCALWLLESCICWLANSAQYTKIDILCELAGVFFLCFLKVFKENNSTVIWEIHRRMHMNKIYIKIYCKSFEKSVQLYLRLCDCSSFPHKIVSTDTRFNKMMQTHIHCHTHMCKAPSDLICFSFFCSSFSFGWLLGRLIWNK